MSTAELERYAPAPPVQVAHERTIEELVAQADKIKQAMQRAMEVDHHYGKIPGAPKPTLFKPGAEKLCLLFRLDPQYESTPVAPDAGGGGHLTVKSVCTLYHIPTGQRFGSGEASCSTRESKYAFRVQKRACPECGRETIIKGKEQYGGGWLCWRKEGKSDGCGAKFRDGDQRIESQPIGRVANEELADSYNTILKMSNKRALVAAVLNVTAASDVFTQDLEDFRDEDGGRDEKPVPQRAVESGVLSPPLISSISISPAGLQNTWVAGVAENPDEPQNLTPELERSILLSQIRGAADVLQLKAPARAKLWVEYLGEGVDPRQAPVEKLTGLLTHLRTLREARHA